MAICWPLPMGNIMNKKPDKWNEVNLRTIIAQSVSKAEVLRKMGYKGYEGGGYRMLNIYIKKFMIDISHFTGQGWNVGMKFVPNEKTPIEKVLAENTYFSPSYVRRRIISDGILDYKCLFCNLTEWNGQPLSLHLDHCNGVVTDNRKENLRFLCPNCHSQTATYCRSKKYLSKTNIKNEAGGIRTQQHSVSKTDSSASWDTTSEKEKCCAFCSVLFLPKEKGSKFCSTSCYHNSTRAENGGQQLKRRKVERPDKNELEILIREHSFCKIGRKYSVSDNAVRKWCKYYAITYK